MRQDYADGGTISHELAHGFGQDKEFYAPGEQCCYFNNDCVSCAAYIVPIALEQKNHQLWRFIMDKFSIMGAADKENKPIDLQWIDRDTYQKNLVYLSTYIDNDFSFRQQDSRQISLSKVIVSGFYYKQEETFIVSTAEVLRTDLVTSSIVKKGEERLPIVTFRLRKGDKGEILEEIKQPLVEGKIKRFYKDGSAKTFPAPLLFIGVL